MTLWARRTSGGVAPVAFACAVVAALCLSVGAAAADGGKSPYGANAISFSEAATSEFSNALAAVHVPMVLFVFDAAGPPSNAGAWQKFISQFSDTMKLFSLKTGYVFSTSPLGKDLVKGFGISVPAVMMFDGLLQPMPNQPQSYGKVPVGYSGDMTLPKMMRWVLSNISPNLITRVNDLEDLQDLFGKYPGYPELPRVLYFPASDYVGPVFRVLSQLFQADAAFGVVVSPFDTEEKAAIAKRYGVRDKADLPAIVVLRPHSSGNADDVVRVDGVTRVSTVEEIAERLHAELPDSAIRSMEAYASTQDGTLVNAVQRRKLYILQEVARERAELFGDEADEPPSAAEEHSMVVTIASQQLWQQQCAYMLQDGYCLAVIAERTEMASAKAVLQKAAKQIVKSIPRGLRPRVRFVVLEAERSRAIAEFFALGQHGLPDVVLLSSASPAVFFNFVGSYSSDNLARFFLSKTQAKTVVGGTRYKAYRIPALEPEPTPTNRSPTGDDEDL